MKPKLLAKPKQSAAKPKKTNMAKPGSGKTLQMTKAAPKSNSPAQTPQFSQAVQNYEGGLRALQERKFDKAKAQFQKVIESGIRELSDRASVHLNACNQHLARTAVAFRTPEEHYDYAISLMNVGDYVTAREHLEQACEDKWPSRLHLVRSRRARLSDQSLRGRTEAFGGSHSPEPGESFPGSQR